MGDHPNAVALRKGYAAFAAGDMETVASLFADDIAWHQAGSSPLSGDLAGKDAVFGTFAQLIQLTKGTFGQEIHDLLANDDHAVTMVEQWWEHPHPFRGNSVHVVAYDGRHRQCGLARVPGPSGRRCRVDSLGGESALGFPHEGDSSRSAPRISSSAISRGRPAARFMRIRSSIDATATTRPVEVDIDRGLRTRSS